MGTRHWFAIQVRSGWEKSIVLPIENKGYEVFSPTYRVERRWSDRIKALELPLFKGYIFCRFDPNVKLSPLVTTPGVIKILGPPGRPEEVDEGEIECIRQVVSSHHKVYPHNFLTEGTKVKIVRGCLSGVEGLLVSIKNHHRLILSIDLLRRSVYVDMDASWLAAEV
jgi:transcription antitermination factor NusG